jgi:lipoprotein-anchoring transpeptidase ErfK/SrfK
MPDLSRRTVLAGLPAALVAPTLAGCVSAGQVSRTGSIVQAPVQAPEPPVARGFGFDYAQIYAPAEGEPFRLTPVNWAEIDPRYLRQVVDYASAESPGTIVVDPGSRFLYHVQEGRRAVRYGVGVGREGFGWSGSATIHDKQEWPDWYPPKEMVQRRPELMKELTELQGGLGLPGGPRNPLGARAMYLWQNNKDTLYRIHGTNEPLTIGTSVSSGCIRMINQDVMHLYARTPVGAKVVVLTRGTA